jgi:hypothetical protein
MVNGLARRQFDQIANLNHVLAQVYENSVTVNEWNKAKEHKAKIKSHSVSNLKTWKALSSIANRA